MSGTRVFVSKPADLSAEKVFDLGQRIKTLEVERDAFRLALHRIAYSPAAGLNAAGMFLRNLARKVLDEYPK